MCFKYILDCFDIHRKADTRFTSIFHLHVPWYLSYLFAFVSKWSQKWCYFCNKFNQNQSKICNILFCFFLIGNCSAVLNKKKISSWIDISLSFNWWKFFCLFKPALNVLCIRKRKTALNYKQFYEKKMQFYEKKYKIGGKIKVSLWSGISNFI